MPRQRQPRRRWRITELSEIDVPPYPAEAMERIVDILVARGEAHITAIKAEIEDIAARYLGMKHSFDQAPKPAEQKAALIEILEAGEKLLDRLEDLDDETAIRLALCASGSILTPTEAKFGQAANTFSKGDSEIDFAVQHLHNLIDVISTTLDQLPKPARGRPQVIAFTAFVWMLARLYEAKAGQRATVSYSATAQTYSGQFLEFVELCAQPLMHIQSKNALGKRVQRALETLPTAGG